jgi:SPOR domain
MQNVHEDQAQVTNNNSGQSLDERRLETERRLREAELRLKERDQRINKLQTWIPVITIIVSVVSSIIASVLTSRTALATQQLDSDTQIRLDQNKYEFSREERKDKRLSENIPKLLSENVSEKKTAKAVIVFFYPNEAQTILDAVATTVNEEQRDALRLDAKEVAAITNQAWGIVIGGDTTLATAQAEVERAKRNKYDLVSVYYRQNYYRTVIGGFSDREAAESANIAVRAKIRDSSYVINLNSWCAGATKAGEGNNAYWQCAN